MSRILLGKTARMLLLLVGFITCLLIGPLLAAATGQAQLSADWRTASRESVGIAPDPAVVKEAVIQVYGARTFSWRGAFAVHTWISVKPKNAPTYTSYQVVGWYKWSGRSVVDVRQGPPDRRWYGAYPELYKEVRGPEAEALIGKVEEQVRAYPYAYDYRTWPGPNSNTFVAMITRAIPELAVDLPPTAIGKDYLGADTFVGSAPSGGGLQLSLFGLVGLTVAPEEGLEFNILGLSFGLDVKDPALRLPGVGRIGWR